MSEHDEAVLQDQPRNRFDRMELAGAFGDLGTLVPFIVAYIGVLKMDPFGVLRAHAEVLSLKTVAARVDAWIALRDGPLLPRGQWRQAASEIGVTPEALYRELARRRK